MSTRFSSVKGVQRMTLTAMMAALAVVIGLYKFPIFAAAPFLEVDFADLPILIATLIAGPVAGLLALAVVAAIQAFVLGGAGWIGFVMHFAASGMMVLAVGIICRNKNKTLRLSLALITGVIMQTLAMIPMSYIFYPIFGLPTETVAAWLLPIIIPFNLIKAGGSAVLTVIIFSALRPLIMPKNAIK